MNQPKQNNIDNKISEAAKKRLPTLSLPMLQEIGQEIGQESGQRENLVASVSKKSIASELAPTTDAEMKALGWDEVDIVFVTGDAYIDHPSFAMAILHRVLQAAGFRVAILPQPDWRNCDAWRQFGKPKLFFAISAGNMDSMINHYTANKKVRNDDAYSPGGRIGLRPDRATLSYCQRAREAFPGVPIIAGGVEASLRRLAHYDYWSDTVRRSILLDCKADLLVYGMGEANIVTIARRLANGENLKDLRDLRGIAFTCGASETPPSEQACSSFSHTLPPLRNPTLVDNLSNRPSNSYHSPGDKNPVNDPVTSHSERIPVLLLPSFEEVKQDKNAFVKATKMIHLNTNPFNAATLIQYHERQAIVVNPPAFPLSEAEMDAIYDLPYSRRSHPRYIEPIPAFEMIKDSITIMRGCFGGCTFCSITAHQGRIIQSRSKSSIISEAQKMGKDKDFKGIISDIGGPTANMYKMRCTRPEVEARCKRLSCVHPTICKLLGTDHAPLTELMQEVRQQESIKKVFVASGIRMDLAQNAPAYLEELAKYHVGGRLKVAPEHTHPDVLRRMKKPDIANFDRFAKEFRKASQKAGKPKQFLVPYFIASHPGSTIAEMVDLAIYLKRHGYRPDQIQDFIPAPFDIATCMWYTGIDPMTGESVPVASKIQERKWQRALMQFFKPENYFLVREALLQIGRQDLIGNGCDALIPAQPTKEALEKRRREAQSMVVRDHDHYHSIKNPTKMKQMQQSKPSEKKQSGYRPGRSSQKRRDGKR